MTSIAIVASSRSRLDSGAIRDSIARNLGGEDDVSLHLADSSAEATVAARAASRTSDIVVAVGGDGTVADVATGIHGSGSALAIIPAGSTNITARSLGIPGSRSAAIAVIVGPHQLRRIDLGISAERCFVHIAGAGIDAETFKGADLTWKRRVGWLAYVPAGAAALRLPPSDVTLRLDTETVSTRSSLILIANGAAALTPAFRIHPRIAVDDGWLDVLVFTSTTAAEWTATIADLGRQRLDQSSHVIWRRTRSLRVEADPPLAVQLDGDPRGTTPREFGLTPAGLAVVTPLRADRM